MMSRPCTRQPIFSENTLTSTPRHALLAMLKRSLSEGRVQFLQRRLKGGIVVETDTLRA